jgi:hypothetical protein
MITRLRKAVARLPSAFRRIGGPSPEPVRKASERIERKRDRLSRGSAFDFKGTLPYPHFMIIGAPKCGTSWLRAALDQYPDVLMLPDEVEYFSDFLDKPR